MCSQFSFLIYLSEYFIQAFDMLGIFAHATQNRLESAEPYNLQ